MNLFKIGLPNEESIVSRDKFIANRIVPIAIRPIPDGKNNFLMLFICYQDYDDSYIYMQIILNPVDAFELDYIKGHPLNISNLKEGTDQMNQYKEMISNIGNTNLFGTDFNCDIETDHPTYYHTCGVRAIDGTHASIVDLYLPRDNYVRLRLYFDKLKSMEVSKNNRFLEFIFTNPMYNNIGFINIESVKHDATARGIFCDMDVNFNHYTMHCGPTKFQMNLITPVDEDHINALLANPLDKGLYDVFYDKHTIVTEIIVEEDCVLVLYEERSLIDGSFKSMKALRLTNELANKTNFVDYNNRIYRGKDYETNDNK